MSTNAVIAVAVLGGDGIGPEVTSAALEWWRPWGRTRHHAL